MLFSSPDLYSQLVKITLPGLPLPLLKFSCRVRVRVRVHNVLVEQFAIHNILTARITTTGPVKAQLKLRCAESQQLQHNQIKNIFNLDAQEIHSRI